MSLLNVGARALMANQTVLQTTGNNIANVNTPGYSRQTVQLQTVESQYSGSGYIGKGVNVATITRSYSEFLTRQAALAGATSAGDTTRAEKLKQLESLFPAGTMGIGAAVSDMLNAFSDVASAPTDLTARTVALTKTNEMANRLRNTSTLLDDLQQGVKLELDQKTTAINTLATSIASVNDKIARATGNGQPPNDLLDQRDQLVRELNQYVQTSSVQATDGTTSVFIGGSQALVMGITAATVALSKDEFGDPNKTKLTLTRAGATITMNEDLLGGGEVSGLLRFQNGDMNEARNLLGRYTLALSTSLNDQHKLGLDLDGNTGGNLFTPATLGNLNIWPDSSNTGAATLGLSITDASQFAASDYEINFTGAAAGTVTRRSDGVVTAFSAVPIVVDGLSISVTAGALNGDRFLIKPFSTAASTIATEFSTPRALAVASPVAGMMGSSNTGSLQLANLSAKSSSISATDVVLTFTSNSTYTRSDIAGSFAYVPGQAITGGTPIEWSLTLKGTPNALDTFTVKQQPAAYRNLNSGNASAMMNVRDLPMFDGAAVTDGYASLIAQIGIRAMSADYSANVSNAIALTAEKERTGVSGVNLDEEASKLLQYQQAYQASAKMIQVASSIFDTLIQTLGR
ncbi:flagellar hook-associated protein FlgK [Rhodoferax sp.]|uniref:flagellar hook-associated protein FlgK n=1 Tax=Rhodoferax sp. TaxID=50421 RepID=UPI00261BD90B|nr:flagellar hook-associated protein FlgK [Rhodoferax sp.]MDD5478607.1 flagellar hook-associated protein FlgK [Rhodoferax sp.]